MQEKFSFPCTDPRFLEEAWLYLASKDSPSFEREAKLSLLFDLSQIQESSRFRALAAARELSGRLLTEEGELSIEAVRKELTLLEGKSSPFFPRGGEEFHDLALRQLKHMNKPAFSKQIKQFHLPLCHSWAERVVRYTLGLRQNHPLTVLDLRRAVLCACFTPLRQSVGSCFASAPALLIQRDTPDVFVKDLYQLLMTGKLKRVFGGVEYAVPLSPSTGVGEAGSNLLSFEHAAFSPSLVAACCVIGCVGEADALEVQTQTLHGLIAQASRGKKVLPLDAWIRECCLQACSLSEEDLSRQEVLEKTYALQFQRSTVGMPLPPKVGDIQRFKLLYEEALETFKGACDNALLKVWEFTLASFAEAKLDVSKWNFYRSLGFSAEERGGIGELLFTLLDAKVSDINKTLEKHQQDYQLAFDQLRASEVLLRNVSSEAEARRLGAEYQSRAYHLRSCQEKRDDLYEQGSHYSQLFAFLLKQYDLRFPEYFQEIYDAQMQELLPSSDADSPAGFRLVYKHGRQDPSTWTLIYDAEQYLHFLIEFFSLTQSAIIAECEWKDADTEIRVLTSHLIQHLRSPLFLDAALQRLESLSSTGKRTPWAYISGGTMETLLKTYYCREGEFSTESRWVESAQDLLIFLLDALKNLSSRALDPYLKRERTGMLMNSPTHAFVLLPSQLQQGWQESDFTYTWVRDQLVQPASQFYASMSLESAAQDFLFENCAQTLSLGSLAAFSDVSSLSVAQWRQKVLSLPSLAATAEQVDAFLYHSLPLIPQENLVPLLKNFLSQLGVSGLPASLESSKVLPPFMTASSFHIWVKSCYLLEKGTLRFSHSLHEKVLHIARKEGTCPPSSLLFADSNWADTYFAFIFNPGTGQLELWKTDAFFLRAEPMGAWRPFLNGTLKKPWTVFTHSYEYL